MESERFLAERQCLGGMCFSQITVENAKNGDSLADDAVWSELLFVKLSTA
jgi:hypothetical protein